MFLFFCIPKCIKSSLLTLLIWFDWAYGRICWCFGGESFKYKYVKYLLYMTYIYIYTICLYKCAICSCSCRNPKHQCLCHLSEAMMRGHITGIPAHCLFSLTLSLFVVLWPWNINGKLCSKESRCTESTFKQLLSPWEQHFLFALKGLDNKTHILHF